MMKPEELIGRYIAYDSEGGAVFARIDEVRRNSRDEVLLITKNMRVRFGGKTNTFDDPRILYFDELMKGTVKVFDIEGDVVTEIEDALFIELLSGKGDYGSAITLVTDDLSSQFQSDVLKKFRKPKYITFPTLREE